MKTQEVFIQSLRHCQIRLKESQYILEKQHNTPISTDSFDTTFHNLNGRFVCIAKLTTTPSL